MTVLALESSTDFASVTLLSGGRVLAEREFPSKRSLSADLFPVLWGVLEGAPAVERIVVGLGPGSYAGVRIAIAGALGLQSVWGCELVGIASVAAMEVQGHGGYRVVGDARRGAWHYTRVEGGVCVEGPLLVASAEALEEKIAACNSPVFAAEDLQGRWGALWSVPRSGILARLAEADRGILQRGDLEPLYLKEPHITPGPLAGGKAG